MASPWCVSIGGGGERSDRHIGPGNGRLETDQLAIAPAKTEGQLRIGQMAPNMGSAAPTGVPDQPNGAGLSDWSDQMGSRGADFCRVQEVMCFSKILRTLSSRGSTSVACPTRVTLATLSPAWLRSTLARAICDP
jgi:hypothetical protein